MLERVRRKRNPLTLLVGMQSSTATMENSVEISLKTGNRTAIQPSNPTAGHTHQGNQNWKRHVDPSVHRNIIPLKATDTWELKGTMCSTCAQFLQSWLTVTPWTVPLQAPPSVGFPRQEYWSGCGEKGTLSHFWWECKLVQPLWRTVWRFLKKLEIKLPYGPAIPLLGIHTKETRTERDTCTPNVRRSTVYNSQDMEAT